MSVRAYETDGYDMYICGLGDKGGIILPIQKGSSPSLDLVVHYIPGNGLSKQVSLEGVPNILSRKEV